MLRIVALLLVGLVCQAEAAFKCVTTTDGTDAAAADCPDDSGGAVTSCFTKTVTDAAGTTTTTTRGCSANDGSSCVAEPPVAPSKAGTACATCITNRDLGCNAAGDSGDFSCYDSVEKKAHVCTDGAKTDKCFIRTKDATEERGCGECVTGTDWTCGTDSGCIDNLDYGCNKPKLTCFDSTVGVMAATTCDIEITACHTKTLLDKSVVRGCGKCVAEKDETCAADCTEEMADGCNEPTRFQCFQDVKDAAKAADCTDNLYTETKCYTNTGNGTAVEKGCGACPSELATGVTCVACDGAKCNSATGLFSMLTVCLAIIYQMA